VRRAAGEGGTHLVVSVPCGEGLLHAGVWIAHVGRLRLLLPCASCIAPANNRARYLNRGSCASRLARVNCSSARVSSSSCPRTRPNRRRASDTVDSTRNASRYDRTAARRHASGDGNRYLRRS
jgi:hypothetical protein